MLVFNVRAIKEGKKKRKFYNIHERGNERMEKRGSQNLYLEKNALLIHL